MPLCYIDDLGFHRVRLDEIKAYIEASERGIYGQGIDLSPSSPDGQRIGLLASDLSDLIQVLEDTYSQRSPSGARGAQLARQVRWNGITKNPPAYSMTTVQYTGTNGTLIPSGSRVGNEDDPTAIFETQADATIASGAASVEVKATVPGPVPGGAGKLTVQMTVLAGITSVTNADAVSIGDDGETDGQLRARRAASVAGPSQGIVDGLKAALLDLDNVQDAIVRENGENSTQTLDDGGDLVAHAIQVIVDNGSDQDIADTIWKRKSLGVTMVGAEVATVLDADGDPHTIKFDRPDDVPVYVIIQSATLLSDDTQDIVRQAIVDRGNGVLEIEGTALPGPSIGEDVSVDVVYDAIAKLRSTTLPKLKVTALIGDSPTPTTDDDVVVGFMGIARWDTGNISFVVI